jgi:DNA-binding beta-propeller fold protein YncE
LAGLGLALLSGCAREPRPAEQAPGATPARLVWPPAPAPARIRHVQNIASPKDLGVKSSAWTRLANFVTGGDKGKERFATPTGVAVDEAGNLCLTDAGAGAVLYFDGARHTCERWEKIGRTRFVTPVAVAKARDILYVADAGRPAVVAFDTKGKLSFLLTNGVRRPAGLAILSNKLFVADAPAHQVAVFDLEGRPLARFGRRGGALGEFNFPTHLAADGQGRLFVTDSMNARIQIFDASGKALGALSSRGDSSGHLSRPKGIALDRENHVYVVDALFDNFQIFDTGGQFLLDVGSAGSKAGEFWLPAGIAINARNQIFVADSYNHRVQVFQYIGTP